MIGPDIVDGVPVRAIAFYLPQYHPIPENDAWWGPGFTEWTNVVRGRPRFPGHEQPHLPGELGFYDLRLPESRERQAALARAYGIYGFCYHYYWFGGRRLLHRPLDEVHRLGTPDLPFCVCWANENWSRRWDGSDDEILIAQAHSPSDDEALLRSLLPLFADKRYIRVGDRPLFIVYRPGILPDALATTARWRALCAAAGLAEPYLVAAQSFGTDDPTPLGFDAAVEFPPHGVGSLDASDRVVASSEAFAGQIFDYEKFARRALAKPGGDYTRFRCVMPSWDNTARRKSRGSVFQGSSPQLYEWWLRSAVRMARAELPADRRLVFINAWNEWGEGCHLEPDDRYGDAYLRATRAALAAANSPPHVPLVSVIVPTFNQAGILIEGLQSVVEQTYANVELIVVDNGSNDETARVLAQFSARSSGHRIRVLSKLHGGAYAALNDGIAAADGEYVAILEDGDRFHPDRLRVLVDVVRGTGARFAFTRGKDADRNGDRPQPDHREQPRGIADSASPQDALGDVGGTIGAGNFFFERSLYDDVGEFAPLKDYFHGEWALRALRFGDPVFVDSELFECRASERGVPEPDEREEREAAAVDARFFSADESPVRESRLIAREPQ